MIRDWILPGLLETGPVNDQVMAIRDGLVNFYVVRGPAGLICIDAGWRACGVRLGFAELGLKMRDVAAVFLTHRHWDHARCSSFYPMAKVFVGGDEDQLNSGKQVRVHDGQIITMAGLTIRCIETPGHTSDSVCYLVDGRYLFTGDALRLKRGRVVSFPAKFNHNRDAAKCSIRRLTQIQGTEWLLTAHTGTTTDMKNAFTGWREAEPNGVLCDGGRR